MGEILKHTLEQQRIIYLKAAREYAPDIIQRFSAEWQMSPEQEWKVATACAQQIEEIVVSTAQEEAEFAFKEGTPFTHDEAKEMLGAGDFGNKIRAVLKKCMEDHPEFFE